MRYVMAQKSDEVRKCTKKCVCAKKYMFLKRKKPTVATLCGGLLSAK